MARISAQLRRASPDAPWLWREDWRRRRIRSSQGALAAMAWVLTLGFGGFALPMGWQALQLAPRQGPGPLLWSSVFVLAALGLGAWAVTATARWRRFRDVVLELETLPGVVGGQLGATLHLGRVLEGAATFRLRLGCLHRSRSGKNTREQAIWQHEIEVPAAHARRGPLGTAVPVRFAIPFECEPSSADPSRLPAIVWRLEAAAELPGADLQAAFEVPVFETAESSETVTERLALEGPAATGADVADERRAPEGPLRDERIRLGAGPDGELELFLPAGRNPLGAALLTLFAGIWNGMLGLVASGFEPLVSRFGTAVEIGLWAFLAPFFAVGLLLLALVPVAWLQSTTVRASERGLWIRHSLPGLGRSRQIPRAAIEALAPRASGGSRGRATWSVRAQLRDRSRSRRVAGDLRHKGDAERIARALWQALGPER